MQLQTIVDIPTFPFNISYKDKLTFIGSCFADNIGTKFKTAKFNTLINPFGVLYNPASVLMCLNVIVSNTFDEEKMITHNDIWHSLLHHGSFSKTSKNEALQNIKNSLNVAHAFIKNTDYLFLTFGTAHVFEYEGEIVANCHKLPAKTFTRRRLSVDEIVEKLSAGMAALKEINPDIKIILSLSPVRYPKDGMHTNSLSKATLLLAIEQLCEMESCFYFPAYEIVLDELRDYRFFAEDMTHPNTTAINYVWEKIEQAFLSNSTIQLKQQINKIVTASLHRPFNTDPAAHHHFLTAMHKKASNLQQQHPEIDLSAELEYFSTK